MWILFLLLLTGIANADVYVTTNPQGGVYDVSSQPDAVVPKGYTRVNLQGQSISNLQILPPYQNYNYINGAFILNTAVVQASNAAQVATANAQAQQQALQVSAITKLTDAISKVATQDVLTQNELNALLPAVNVSVGTGQP